MSDLTTFSEAIDAELRSSRSIVENLADAEKDAALWAGDYESLEAAQVGLLGQLEGHLSALDFYWDDTSGDYLDATGFNPWLKAIAGVDPTATYGFTGGTFLFRSPNAHRHADTANPPPPTAPRRASRLLELLLTVNRPAHGPPIRHLREVATV